MGLQCVMAICSVVAMSNGNIQGDPKRLSKVIFLFARLSQTAPVSFLGSLAVSVGVCWHVMFRRDAMGLSGECLGVSGGI